MRIIHDTDDSDVRIRRRRYVAPRKRYGPNVPEAFSTPPERVNGGMSWARWDGLGGRSLSVSFKTIMGHVRIEYIYHWNRGPGANFAKDRPTPKDLLAAWEWLYEVNE